MLKKFFKQYSNTPNEIIISGWEGSGSTFLYQAAKSLNLKVEKIHGSKKSNDKRLAFYTFRDPRDSICSTAMRSHGDIWKTDGPEKAILCELDIFIKKRHPQSLLNSIRMQNVILIKYEDYFLKNENLLIKLIANQFLIPINSQKIKKILNNISIEANILKSNKFKDFSEYDPETHIHGNHITNKGKTSGWKKFFTPVIEKRFKEELGQLLINLGYEENSNWSN